MAGWVKLHRSFFEPQWWDDENTSRLYIYLIGNANYEDKTYKNHLVKRGSMVSGRAKLCIKTGLSEGKLRTALKHLKSTGHITSRTYRHFSIISVTNWDEYQGDNQHFNRLDDSLPDVKRYTYKEVKKKERRNNTEPKTNNAYQPIIKEITSYLSHKIGKNLNPNANCNKAPITARLKEGYTLEQFKHVIDVKYNDWAHQPKMAHLIASETIFGNKMDKYLNQCEVQLVDHSKNLLEHLKSEKAKHENL